MGKQIQGRPVGDIAEADEEVDWQSDSPAKSSQSSPYDDSGVGYYDDTAMTSSPARSGYPRSTPMTSPMGSGSRGRANGRSPAFGSFGKSNPHGPQNHQTLHGPQTPNRRAAHTLSRVGSLIGAPPVPGNESTSEFLSTLTASHSKIVDATAALIAEIELRLGLRTLPAAQTQVRLESLRLCPPSSDPAMAHTLLQENYYALSRLEAICESLRRCGCKPACCHCQLPVTPVHGPLLTVADLVNGRTVQAFLAECADRFRNRVTGECHERQQMRAVFDGLDPFFLSFLGRFDPRRSRCVTEADFLEAWKTMTQQPAFLNFFDAELNRIQANALDKRDRGEHNDKTKLARRLSNLLNGGSKSKGSKDSRES